MIDWRKLFFIVCVFFAPQLSASEPVPPDSIGLNNYPAVITFLNEYVSYLVDEEDLSGLSILIVNDQNIVWEKGFGFSDTGLKKEAGPDTLYQAGAVTGLLTAALVVRLSEEGLLGLDDDISKYLPELLIQSRYKNDTTITIRNLLTHHAGLPINVFNQSWDKQPPEFRSLLDSSIKLRSSYPPETIYAFSNVGYSLLGLIIEKVTGQSFSSSMKKYIFNPLNMDASSVDNNSELMKLLATGYKDGKTGQKLLPRDTPSVGLATTTKDLSRFIRLYFRGESEEWRNAGEAIRIQNSSIKLDVQKQVGFSWYVGGMNVQNAGRVLWRGGATPYYRSRVAMLPDHKLGVVILSNDSKSWEVISKISEKALQLMLEAKTGIKQPDEKEKKNTKISVNKYLNPASFSTAYTSFVGYIAVEKSRDKYRTNVLGWPFLLIKDEKDKGWFTLEYDLLGFIPIDVSWISGIKVRPAIIDNRNVLIVYYKSHQYLFGQHLGAQKVHPGWSQLVGEYKIKNRDSLLDSMKIKSGELLLKQNGLFFVYRLPFWFGVDLEIPLQTLSDTETVIPGLGTGLNETISVKRIKGQRLLEYSGYLLERKKVANDLFNFEF
ncbi:MAG: beta-lactamase family protein [Gammaproteobacteria bacterium]|nr:beta-lactamase family protein [Gammaproteobacteria bacterium]